MLVGLKVFRTALAILDDRGAILVIALFYTAQLYPMMLVGGLAVLAALYGLNRVGVRALSPGILGGAARWACLFHAGVHPTLAGVGLAFVVPRKEIHAQVKLATLVGSSVSAMLEPLVLAISRRAHARNSPRRLEHR